EWRGRIDRALELGLAAVRRGCLYRDEQVGINGRRRHVEFESHRAGDLGLPLERRRHPGHARAIRRECRCALTRGRAPIEAAFLGVEKQLGPTRTLKRLCVLLT